MDWRANLKSLTPPALIKYGRLIFKAYPPLRFEGSFNCWDSAAETCGGYDAENILAKVESATEFVLGNNEFFERDGVVLEKREPPFHLLWAIEKTLAEFGEVRVMDFGGALGSHYRQVREYFPRDIKMRWNVIEQENFVKVGRKFESDELTFQTSMKSCLDLELTPNLIILSSVLQYLASPLEKLEEFANLSAKYMLIDRTPMLRDNEYSIVIQKVPPSIYEAVYPANLIGIKRYKEVLFRAWSPIAEWHCLESLPWVNNKRINQTHFHGMLLQKLQK